MLSYKQSLWSADVNVIAIPTSKIKSSSGAQLKEEAASKLGCTVFSFIIPMARISFVHMENMKILSKMSKF